MRSRDSQAAGPVDVQVRLLLTNPAAAHVETASTDWTVLGTRPERIAETIDDSTSFSAVVEEVQSLPGEYSVVCIDGDHATVVRAYRGITSSYNVYYSRRPEDGAVVVGDHFRTVLSELPAEARTVPTAVGPDQLLLGTRPVDSYVEEVGRLGHGEQLDWPPAEDPETRLVESLEPGDPITTNEAKRRLDRHFREELDAGRMDGPVKTMLSGGVDSTLLHSYLDVDDTVSAAFDSPEFAFEVDYAREASDLLGSDHELLTYDEDDYLDHLEATVDATGHPLLLPQATLIHRTFADSDGRTYVNGALADGLFGTGTAALAHVARYTGRAARLLPEVSWEVEGLKETAAGLRRTATDPDGCGMNFRIHSHPERVAEFYGRGTVVERKRRRLRYTRRRVPYDDRPGYAAHMHLGHWIDFYHDELDTIWQHAAHASGATMHTPYCGRAVAEIVLAVPPEERYATFTLPSRANPTRPVQYKYLLKELLAERLPGYEVTKPKGHGQLPTDRYFAEGPLADVFDRYAVPEFVPEGHRESVRRGTDNLSWYAANYAIWRDRVLENDDLAPVKPTTVVER